MAIAPVELTIPWKQAIQDYTAVPIGTCVEHDGRTEKCPMCGLGAIVEIRSTEDGERRIYHHRREWSGEPREDGSYLSSEASQRCVEGLKEIGPRKFLLQLSGDHTARVKCESCGWGIRRRTMLITATEVFAMADDHECALREVAV